MNKFIKGLVIVSAVATLSAAYAAGSDAVIYGTIKNDSNVTVNATDSNMPGMPEKAGAYETMPYNNVKLNSGLNQITYMAGNTAGRSTGCNYTFFVKDGVVTNAAGTPVKSNDGASCSVAQMGDTDYRLYINASS